MNTKMKIEIRLLKDCGDLKAYADITIRVKFGEITIKRFKVLARETKPWISFPQVQYSQGFSTRYLPLLNLNKRVETYITNQILKAYRNAIDRSAK